MRINPVLQLLILFGYGKAAFVNISVPNSEVELGADIKIEVVQISPNTSSQSFDRLDCGIMLPGDSSYKIIVAQYDKHSLNFKSPSHGIPERFRDRISYVGRMSFVIRRIRIEDKFMKVMCILNYKNGSLTSHVESQTYKIKIVYVNPTFHSNSTPGGFVKIAYGVKTGIECTVTGWPPSRIHWESSIVKDDFKVRNSTSARNGVVAVKSTFMLRSPSFHYDGKNVACVAVPKHGTSLRRGFTLKYSNVKPTFHINSTPQGIVKIAYGQNTKLKCIVISWPPSVVIWEIDIAKSEYIFKEIKSEYNGSVVVGKIFILQSPSFRLDGQKVTCIATSNNGTTLRRGITLSYTEVNPTFQSNSTPKGVVEITNGQRAKIKCIVASWPASRIHWESSLGTSEFKATNSTSEYEGAIAVKSIFTLESHSSNHDGKKVACVATSSSGKVIRREFNLKYQHDDGEKTGGMPTWIIVCAIIGVTVVAAVASEVIINQLRTKKNQKN